MFLQGSVRLSKDLQRFSSRCCRISFKDLTRSLRVLATYVRSSKILVVLARICKDFQGSSKIVIKDLAKISEDLGRSLQLFSKKYVSFRDLFKIFARFFKNP